MTINDFLSFYLQTYNFAIPTQKYLKKPNGKKNIYIFENGS